jgi:hypothetical protein
MYSIKKCQEEFIFVSKQDDSFETKSLFFYLCEMNKNKLNKRKDKFLKVMTIHGFENIIEKGQQKTILVYL